MNGRSAKNKGYRFEAHLLERFQQEVDANTHRNAGSGSGLNKGDIRIPSKGITIEAKNQRNISLIESWEQAKQESFHHDIPMLAIRNPRKAEFQETLMVMSLETAMELIKGSGGSVEVSPKLSYEQRSALSSLKNTISRIQKVFPHE